MGLSNARVPPSPGHLTFKPLKCHNLAKDHCRRNMPRKYRALRFIGLILKIIGGLELAVGLVSVLMLPLIFSDSNTLLLQLGFKHPYPGSGLLVGILSGLFVFLCGTVIGLLTFSAGEIFNILISIEENTRAALQLMRKQE